MSALRPRPARAAYPYRTHRTCAEHYRGTQERHLQTRQGDEIACSCGRRWAANEKDPHE